MRSGLLVVTFREFPHQLLEYIAHIHSRNLIYSHIGFLRTKLTDYIVENIVVVELGNLLLKVKLLDDIDNILGESLQVVAEVVGDVVGIRQKPFKGKT